MAYPDKGGEYFFTYSPHMFVNLQAMGLAMISVHPGGVSDKLFRDIPDAQVKEGAVIEGKNFLKRMQLFRTHLRNALLNQQGKMY